MPTEGVLTVMGNKMSACAVVLLLKKSSEKERDVISSVFPKGETHQNPLQRHEGRFRICLTEAD